MDSHSTKRNHVEFVGVALGTQRLARGNSVVWLRLGPGTVAIFVPRTIRASIPSRGQEIRVIGELRARCTQGGMILEVAAHSIAVVESALLPLRPRSYCDATPDSGVLREGC